MVAGGHAQPFGIRARASETVGVYTLHETVTSTDPELTALQKSHRSVAPFLEFTMMYRF